MKKAALLPVLAMSLPVLLAAADEKTPPPGYKLVWSEEFDAPGLPDPAKWSYEVGLVRNKEEQYYTEGRKENARVENGHLVLEGIKEEFKNAKFQEGSANWQHAEKAKYTSGSIHTNGKASWTYGRVEVRAKLPAGAKGMWPAIWMLGTNIGEIGWPKCGEIDIMEFVGKEPNHVFGTLHWFNPEKGKHDSRGGKHVADPPPSEDFHRYTVDWTAEKIDFYYDDLLYHTHDLTDPKIPQGADNPFHKPQYLILNLALGGAWGGKIDDSALPQQFLVDYVRVYQKE
jgi:beta-glucanase (GH16 family)